MKFNIPQDVLYILNTLDEAGYESYAVGGCVRDCLLGKKPDDWDICTSATPDEIQMVFLGQRLLKTGLKHGTLTLILQHKSYEITTFRTESGYSDSRRPDKVNFVASVEEDLARRDFTVNAKAYNPKVGLIDLYGGQEDLENKIIRCVGDAYERFCEDALRIMRAIRFSAVLGFGIEERTIAAIEKLSYKLKNIAIERINVEFTKTLLADDCINLYKYKDALCAVISNIQKLDKNDCVTIKSLPKDKTKRLSLLLMSLFSDVGSIKTWLFEMRYDTKTTKEICDIVSCKDTRIPIKLKETRHLVLEYGFDAVKNYFEIQNAVTGKGEYKNVLSMLDEIIKNELCISVSQLKIDGQKLIELGFQKGPQIGKVLNKLLDLVIDEKIENTEETLINAAILWCEENIND